MVFVNTMQATARWRDTLTISTRRECAILVTLALYVVLWTGYAVIGKSSQDLHPDMTEIIAWSRDPSLGYLKHPPLAAWVVWLWFSIFPIADWSYYLLAMLMPALTLWIIWRLSADYLDIEKRVVGVAVLTFVPFFNFHALKFNVNTVLLPLWAATTFFFLRSFKTRGAIWAALAGIAAAGAMLGKYWSIFLITGLGLAALADQHRASYFRSSAPWITIAAGLLALGAHLVWLVGSDFAPFSYAVSGHGERSPGGAFLSALGYLAGASGYVAAPIIIFLAMVRPDIRTSRDIVWPTDPSRRLAASAFWAPLLLPVFGALAGHVDISSLWSMPAFSLLPVVMLSSPAVVIRATDTRRILLAAAVFPLVALVASPLVAIMVHRAGPEPAVAQTHLLAKEVARLWHQRTQRPLAIVGGEEGLAFGVAAYSADRPKAVTFVSRPNDSEVVENGLIMVCLADDARCAREAMSRGPSAELVEVTVERDFWGFPGKPQNYAVMILPPRR
jgi:4-amino-4-deoxy-L-arabinose transferase-like glycosyltransferase